jgi:protein-tyrosine phosphatase
MEDFNPYTLTELPFHLPGRVYRSPMPFHPQDSRGELFRSYQQAGVQAVVLLLPRDEVLRKTDRDLVEFYRREGLQVIEMPIQDFSVPQMDLLEAAIDEAVIQVNAGRNVVVHCYAGYGRTGTFLACMAVRVLNLDGRKAVSWVRKYVPPALENEEQVRFVQEYGARHADHSR